jgi:LysM repeat protein
LPTTPVTVAPPQSSLPAVAGEQKYTIQPGDYPISVKDKFGVTLEALDAANTATPGYKEFYAGTEIVIPAGGVPQTTLAPGQTTVPSVAAGPTTTTTTIAGGQPNCGVGSYTLESGDTPSGVAKKFGTTVGELEAINADTNGYSAFYVGLVIKIPAKTAC